MQRKLYFLIYSNGSLSESQFVRMELSSIVAPTLLLMQTLNLFSYSVSMIYERWYNFSFPFNVHAIYDSYFSYLSNETIRWNSCFSVYISQLIVFRAIIDIVLISFSFMIILISKETCDSRWALATEFRFTPQKRQRIPIEVSSSSSSLLSIIFIDVNHLLNHLLCKTIR